MLSYKKPVCLLTRAQGENDKKYLRARAPVALMTRKTHFTDVRQRVHTKSVRGYTVRLTVRLSWVRPTTWPQPYPKARLLAIVTSPLSCDLG